METFKEINSLPVLLKDPNILVIGGGSVALQKVKVLMRNKINFHLVAEKVCDQIKELTDNYFERSFINEDINGFQYIVDATGNNQVGKILRELKHTNRFLLNRVDVPSECDFYFSSLLELGKLKIAVSSDGASPTLAKLIRDKIKDTFPTRLSKLTDELALERSRGKANVPAATNKFNQLLGKVTLVGCGTGDPELLTIKAFKAIKTADIILYDYLVSKEILELIPETSKMIFAGKPHSQNTISQDDINLMMFNYANQGNNVVRLKNGDPYIFGRGSEEAEFLLKQNINVEVIPGLSSVIAAPSYAGIPLTARGVASDFTVLTACNKDRKINMAVIKSVLMENHTTVVLMGLTKVEEIREELYKEKVNPKLPAAFICNASRTNQKVILTNVEKLVEDAEKAESPAIIIFGEVVNYNKVLPSINSEINVEI